LNIIIIILFSKTTYNTLYVFIYHICLVTNIIVNIFISPNRGRKCLATGLYSHHNSNVDRTFQ